MRHIGTIKTWKDDRGFGFITPRGGGEPVFVHIKSFDNRIERPAENEVVTYELEFDEQRRPNAVSVRYESPERSVPSPRRSILPAVFGAFIAYVAIAAWCAIQGVAFVVPIGYALVSLATFASYSYDKKYAQSGDWRISESTLHILALLGGWPGAIIGQHVFNHKLRKSEFMVKFWLIVAVNIVAVACLTTDVGQTTLRAMALP